MEKLKQLEDKLNKDSHRFSTISIAISPATKQPVSKFLEEDVADNIADCIAYISENYLENPQALYHISMYKKGKQSLDTFVQTTQFRCEEKKQYVGSVGIDPNFVNQLVEAERKAAVAEYQMNEMAKEILEDEEDEEEDNGILGAITKHALPQIVPMLPELIGAFIENLKQKRETLQVAGVPDEVNTYIDILLNNGVTPDHLKKLADMAQNQKTKFKSLLLML
jgi:hypothetical protein